MRIAGTVLVLGLALGVAGCGGGGTSSITGSCTSSSFAITTCSAAIDTNGTVQFAATLTGGGAATVTWSLDTTSGDPNAGPGTITANGLYTPPSYLTVNSATVRVVATLAGSTLTTPVDVATVTVTPGFIQPLTPENSTVGANGSVKFYGYTSEVGGSTNINYVLSGTPTGSSGGIGTLSAASCIHNNINSANASYTYCQVTYTAPATLSGTTPTYLVATIGTTSSKLSAGILLDGAGVTSNPATHQAVQSGAIELGTSGGNNNDYDTATNIYNQTYITDCCGGTLGSLVKDQNGNKYILSNNHVLAESDQASLGSTIVQPGLIEDGCIPAGYSGAAVYGVANLTGYVTLANAVNNVDAAIAAISPGYVDNTGGILELGLPSGSSLLTAPPAAGTGETPTVGMTVAKSGRTTGLTCSTISAFALTEQVQYYFDCAETKPYYNKTYTNQVLVQGVNFSDSGDSGSLIVDVANAQPVALLYAGGLDTSGNTVTIANPVSDVLTELGTQTLSGTSTFSFVGGATHPVSCINYDSNTFTPALHIKQVALSTSETARQQAATSSAQSLVNVKAGILGVAAAQSYDRPGEAAVLVYTDKGQPLVTVPATVNGVRTIVVPTDMASFTAGNAPTQPQQGVGIANSTLNKAVTLKQHVEKSLLTNGSYFGVGVGQSYDNPNEAAMVILVDKNNVPATLPATVNGLRTRYIIMERLHVSRSYNTAAHPSRCDIKRMANQKPTWQPPIDRVVLH